MDGDGTSQQHDPPGEDHGDHNHEQEDDPTTTNTFFVEKEEVLSRLASTIAAPSSSPPSAEILMQEIEWLIKILDKYQEQPNLLDPALEEILSLVFGRARVIVLEFYHSSSQHFAPSSSSSSTSAPTPTTSFPFRKFEHAQLHALFVVVYTLCRLRGYKTVTKFFPHDAADLEPVLHALQSQDRQDHRRWQSRYGLLLWLSMLVIVPFDICSIDSGLAGASSAGGGGRGEEQQQQLTLVGSLCELATEYLRDPGPTREAAAVCLASLLKRPDMEKMQLAKFLSWSEGVLMPSSSSSSSSSSSMELQQDDEDNNTTSLPPFHTRDAFLLLGVLQTLSVLLKAGHRQHLLSFLPSLLTSLASLDPRDFGSQTLNRKLKMKLLQRIGLAYLPPRVAKWRYQRGQRSLLDNLKKQQQQQAQEQASTPHTHNGAVAAPPPPPPPPPPPSSASSSTLSSMPIPQQENEEEEDDEDEEDDIPEDLEEIVEELLSGLRDRDTIVRWSAAKGIGRITARLPLSFADEVVASVLMSFTEGATDSAWHGGCLALAELARRGLLLPSRLAEVVPVVAKAIQYDVRRGYTSVGAHVRDAACYVCWAFARAYSPQVMSPHVAQLCEGMLVTSLFDREINCRRAASAAFQENVGRQGHENFPHGIAILTAADYFTLGNRTVAYLKISRFVAQFPRYKVPILRHLTEVKLRHWDVSLRVLASETLRVLTCVAPEHILQVVLPSLLRDVDAVDLNRRHGALLGVAEAFLGLAELPSFLPADLEEAVVEVVPKIEKARLYRGRGGECVRAAACRLIECVALAGVALPIKSQLRLLDSIDENLRHPVEEVQTQAVAALRAFTHTYFGQGDGPPSTRLHARVVEKYKTLIDTDDNVAVTRGFVRALGVLPARLLRPCVDVLLVSLEGLTAPLRKVGDEPDAETRRNALGAVVEMVQTLGFAFDESTPAASGGANAADDSGGGGSGGGDSGNRGGGGRQGGGLTKAQTSKVLHLLLRATEDYATDKRGDIGSWVRMAALQGLATVVPLAVKGGGGRSNRHAHTHTHTSTNENEQAEVEVEVEEGEQVLTAYGKGTVREVRCDGRVVHVQFARGEVGAYFFPYAQGTGVFARKACRPFLPQEKEKECETTSMIIANESDDIHTQTHTHTSATSSLAAFVDSELLGAIVAAVLKQLCEKLDLVRECAGSVLLKLLSLPGIPDQAALQAAFLHDNTHTNTYTPTTPASFKGGSTSFIFPRVVRLLEVETYHYAIVAGLVISIGGLTESVVKSSLGAMVEWAQHVRREEQQQDLSSSSRSAGVGGAAVGDTGGVCVPLSIHKLGQTLLALFDAHAKDDRVICPLLRSIDLFFQKGVFLESEVEAETQTYTHTQPHTEAEAQGEGGAPTIASSSSFSPSTSPSSPSPPPPSSSFAWHLTTRLRHELSGCRDIKKMLACLNVAIHLLHSPLPLTPTQEHTHPTPAALRIVLLLLGHRFPRVRKAAAEQLYTKLLLSDQLLEGEEEIHDQVLEVLTGTNWDQDDLPTLRQARDRLCALFVIVPPSSASGLSTSESMGGKKTAAQDELASYAALVKEMGY